MEEQPMSTTTGFEGLTAVISGGASGIGAAAADAFAAKGANVAVLDLNANDAHWSHRCDVSDDNQVRLAVAAVKEHFGGVDIVVNNAGIGAVGTVEENSDKQWFRVLDVNLLGMVRLSRACLPHLRDSKAPAIVNTTSIAALTGLVNRALYSASKGAVHSLTLAMAADHVAEGIRVNCVSPGTADTPWVQRLLEQAEDPAAERARLEARQPTGRLVSPEEVAAAIVYLADPANKSLTGTSLAVDGGLAGLRIVR
jgi:2-keto-3-deoxy-L-fuconate dehydrogenase